MLLRACLLLAAAATGALGCAPRLRMCNQTTECGVQLACVAGRCQREGRVSAVQKASVQRWLVAPEAIACLQRGDGEAAGRLPQIIVLGNARGPTTRMFLRFPASLPRDAQVIEAYLLLERVADVDSDPVPIRLHATRVLDAWDPLVVRWGTQPRTEDVRAPATLVGPRSLVRLDVRDIVERWRRGDRSNQGLSIEAETTSPTGIAFAIAPAASADEASGRVALETQSSAPRPLFASEPARLGLGALAEVTPVPPRGRPPTLELYVELNSAAPAPSNRR